MSNGLGAAFVGIALFAVLLAIAGLLVVTAGVAVFRRHRRDTLSVQYVAAGLVGAVVVVAGFGIVALADEATALAVLFATVVALPLVLVAVRARWAGAPWMRLVATSGMAWSLPFLVGVGLLFALQTYTDASSTVQTGLAGIVTTGGALLAGEHVGGLLDADY